MANIREMLDKRAQLITQARSIVDGAEAEKRDFSAEEDTQYNSMMEDVGKLDVKIKREKQLVEAEGTLDREPVAPDERALPAGMADEHAEERSKIFNMLNTPEYRRAMREYLKVGDINMMNPEHANEIRNAQQELRALQTDIDTSGGYMFGMQTSNRIIKSMDNILYIRKHATVLQLEGASAGLGCPTLENDPGDAEWTGEITPVPEDSTMSFGQRELKPNLLAKLVKVSMKMLSKLPNIDNVVSDRLAYKMAVPQENNYMNGSGAGQPLGVFTASANGIPTSRDSNSGHATQVTADGIISMKYALKSQYWPRARWTFHRDTMSKIAKLKDGNGQYMWQPSMRDGEPDRLRGFPIDVSEYAPNTFTENSYVGLLGDWSHYWILDEMLVSIQVLKELYAGKNQVGFIGRGSFDGMPVLAEAFVRMKLSAG